MNLTKDKAIEGLKLFDCTTAIKQTNHPRYAIGFIERKGCSVGKIVYLDGQYSHIKWYSEQRKYWSTYIGWEVWRKTGELLSAVNWDHHLILAEQLIEDTYNTAKQWREANPCTLKADGTRRKRKPLQRKDLLIVLRSAIFQSYGVLA